MSDVDAKYIPDPDVSTCNAITIPSREDRIGTARQEFAEKVAEVAPEMAKAFEDLTPEQRAAGKLMGFLNGATGKDKIEAAFAWYETEIGQKLDILQKLMAIYVALEHSGCQDLGVYNAACMILLKVNRR